MAHITRPPKEIDLPSLLFTEPGFQPTYGRTSYLSELRKNYSPHELTFRQQRAGLFLARTLLQQAVYTQDPEIIEYAQRHSATMLLGASWHTFAEVRPGQEEDFPFRDVRRRRLKLPDYTLHKTEERPSVEQLNTFSIKALSDCISGSTCMINALKSRSPEYIEDIRIKLGRQLGTTALMVATSSIGNVWEKYPYITNLDTQIHLMEEGQKIVSHSQDLSNQIGNVPTPAMLADPNGSILQTLVKDTMPGRLVDRYHEAEGHLDPF